MNKITDVVREQKEAITEATEDCFPSQPYGPLLFQHNPTEAIGGCFAITPKDMEWVDSVKLNMDWVNFVKLNTRQGRSSEGQHRCVDCKYHHPGVWGRSGKPRKEGSCKLKSKFDTYYDTIFWTCDTFERKEKEI